ncbi:MAG: zf-HC2 domain-containing protein [Gammaproteobacteria bacterium]|nr:MAG: zf-HC2 domain-containing protein [Gammaproteobacteria bacterium]
MLKCKEVAHLASEYIDNNTTAKITWQMRLHLITCANCRRFIKHLRTTKLLAVKLAKSGDVDAEAILRKIKERI